MCIHGNINAGYGSMHLCTIFQFNCHRFMAQFHQKSATKEKNCSHRNFVWLELVWSEAKLVNNIFNRVLTERASLFQWEKKYEQLSIRNAKRLSILLDSINKFSGENFLLDFLCKTNQSVLITKTRNTTMLRAMLNRLTVQRFARSLNMPVLSAKRHCCAHFARIRFVFTAQPFEQHSAQPLTFRVNHFACLLTLYPVMLKFLPFSNKYITTWV